MFVEKTDFGFAKIDRLEYVPARRTILDGSIRAAQIMHPEQVWGLGVHLPERGFVLGIKTAPNYVADMIQGVEARRRTLDREMKALLAEEKKLLALAWEEGINITVAEVKRLAGQGMRQEVTA